MSTKNTPYTDLVYGGVDPTSQNIQDILQRINRATEPEFIEKLQMDGYELDTVSVWYKNDVMNTEAPEHSVRVIETRVIDQRDDRPRVTQHKRDPDKKAYKEVTGPSQKQYAVPRRFIYCVVEVTVDGASRSNVGYCDMEDFENGDPFSSAYAMAYKRALAMFGLSVDLYHKDNNGPRYQDYMRLIKQVIAALQQGLFTGAEAQQIAKLIRMGKLPYESAKALYQRARKQKEQQQTAGNGTGKGTAAQSQTGSGTKTAKKKQPAKKKKPQSQSKPKASNGKSEDAQEQPASDDGESQ